MLEIVEPTPGNDSVNELHVQVLQKHIIYTDYTRRFPIRARSGNQYNMVSYHSSNVVLVELFSSRKDKNRLVAYNVIMQRLNEKYLLVDLHILYNEYSKEYKATIRNRWKVQFQLVLNSMHRRNAAERSIQTFKAHFLAILAGVAPYFPRNLWDILLPQTEMALNLMRQATSNPTISVWEYFNGNFNYNSAPLGLLGIFVIVHTKTGRQQSWDFCGKDVWSVGEPMTHYCCQRVIPKLTR